MTEIIYLRPEEFETEYGLDYIDYTLRCTTGKEFIVVGAVEPVYELEWMLILDGFAPLSYTILPGALTLIAAVKR